MHRRFRKAVEARKTISNGERKIQVEDTMAVPMRVANQDGMGSAGTKREATEARGAES